MNKLISFIFIIFISLFSYSFSFSQNSETTTVDSTSYEERISELEKKLISINNPPKIDNIEEYNNILNKINEAGRSVSLGQLFLSSNMLTIYTALMAITIATAIATYNILKSMIQRQIIKQTSKHLSNEMDEFIENSRKLINVKCYSQQALAWWEHYTSEYKNLLEGREYDKSLHREVKISRLLSEKGLNELNSLENLDGRLLNLKEHLNGLMTNHWTYHRTVEISINEEEINDDDNIDKVLEKAQECLNISSKVAFKDFSHNFRETAAFCFIKLGNDREKRKGVKILTKILKDKNSRIPNDWVLKMNEKYFPTIDGVKTDLHNTGINPNAM